MKTFYVAATALVSLLSVRLPDAQADTFLFEDTNGTLTVLDNGVTMTQSPPSDQSANFDLPTNGIPFSSTTGYTTLLSPIDNSPSARFIFATTLGSPVFNVDFGVAPQISAIPSGAIDLTQVPEQGISSPVLANGQPQLIGTVFQGPGTPLDTFYAAVTPQFQPPSLASQLGPALFSGLEAIKTAFQAAITAVSQVRDTGLEASAIAFVVPGLQAALPELLTFEAEMIGAATLDAGSGVLPSGFDPPVPPATPGGIVSPQIAADFNQISADIQRGIALAQATQSAIIGINNDGPSGNLTDAASLENQAAANVAALQATSQAVAADITQLENDLRAAGLSDVSISQADLVSFLASLEANGFPDSELQVFADLGLSPTDISNALASLQGIDLTGLPLSLYGVFDLTAQDFSGVSPVPEPPSLALLGGAFFGLFLCQLMMRKGATRRQPLPQTMA